MVNYLHDTYRVSERRACRVARIPVSTFRSESRQEPRTALRMRIREIAQILVRYGYRKIRVLLNREGWKVGNVAASGLLPCTGGTPASLRHGGSVGPRCIVANASGQPLPMKCGVWISWLTNWQMDDGSGL